MAGACDARSEEARLPDRRQRRRQLEAVLAAEGTARGRLCPCGGRAGTLDDRRPGARDGGTAEKRGGHQETPRWAWSNLALRHGLKVLKFERGRDEDTKRT